MLFNSYVFLFAFLPITWCIYFLLAAKKCFCASLGWLVVASLVFYSYWDIRYLPLLVLSILFNFFIGRKIEQVRTKKSLAVGVIINLLLLGYFKYAGFFLSTLNEVTGSEWYVPHIILPLGISFFTFTQTAYLVDAYRGETRCYSFVNYALFVTIFPHLIAGPILNHKNMIPQFSKLKNFTVNYQNLALGICMFTIGLFKKVIVADELSPWVAMAFNHAYSLTLVEAWMGALMYTFQLYFDFSGYSDMAIGLGLLFNFHLPINFNSPYKACSVIDFWRRWHMTLSTWVKDYLYIPLGGNRYGELARMRNLWISMILIGLWHGAGWTFIFWGALHGVFLMINHQWRKRGLSLPRICNWLITFVAVIIAWVFFRADSFSIAWAMLSGMSGLHGVSFHHLMYIKGPEYGWLAALCFMTLCCRNTQERMASFVPSWKWLIPTALLFAYIVVELNKQTEFLYFQF